MAVLKARIGGVWVPLGSDSAVADFINDPDSATSDALDARGRVQGIHNVKDYGAVGDGVANDTAAIQAAVDATTTGSIAVGTVFLPPGTYKINAAITVPKKPGWRIEGSGPFQTDIIQSTDNVPIFDLGATGASEMHSYRIAGIRFLYTNTQPVGNTLACPIYFSAEGYFGEFKDLQFYGGTYGIRTKAAVVTAWAQSWDQLQFGQGLSLGAVHMIDGAGGAPNNKWGRIGCDATTMAGPVFYVKGSNWSVGAVEVFGIPVNAKIWYMFGGTAVDIGAIKLEGGTYNTPGLKIFEFADTHVHIGTLSIHGSNLNLTPASGFIQLIQSSTADSYVEIGSVYAAANTITGSCVIANCSAGCRMVIGSVRLFNGWNLVSNGSSTAADLVVVRDYNNGRLSSDKGDADYTFALKDPTIVSYGTPFTAPRTITLPSKTSDTLASMTVRIVINGAINGANTLTIKEGANTLRTETVDKRALTYTYRRNLWVLTGYETLP